MSPLILALLEALRELVGDHVDDLVGRGFDLLERLVKGEATDEEVMAYLRARQEAGR